MATRHFRLHHETGRDILGLSRSLEGMGDVPEFCQLTSAMGLAVERVETPKNHWSELRIEPPIPGDRISEFGEAVIGIALSQGYDGNANVVAFWNHADDNPQLIARG